MSIWHAPVDQPASKRKWSLYSKKLIVVFSIMIFTGIAMKLLKVWFPGVDSSDLDIGFLWGLQVMILYTSGDGKLYDSAWRMAGIAVISPIVVSCAVFFVHAIWP